MNLQGFFDLNVHFDGSDVTQLFQKWHKSLYRTIALNQTIDLVDFFDQKNKKKGEKSEIIVPEPVVISLPSDLSGKIRVLNRLTIKVSDVSHFPKIFQTKASILKKYDIIAVTPMNHACLLHVSTLHGVDLISIDCQSKPDWKLSKKLYNTIVDHNKYFELCYSPALRDSSTLKNLIFMSHLLYTVGKSKNVVLSSGTSDTFLLRSPYEVIHLSLIFGFGENKARTTITSDPSSLVIKSLKRRQGKSCISVLVD